MVPGWRLAAHGAKSGELNLQILSLCYLCLFTLALGAVHACAVDILTHVQSCSSLLASDLLLVPACM